MLLDMLTALALCGVIFYAIAAAFERRGSAAMSTAVLLLFTIAPFSILEPLAYLSRSAVYNQRFDWLYLGLAVGIALISYRRQRKSFYYAGLINSGLALILIGIAISGSTNPRGRSPSWASAQRAYCGVRARCAASQAVWLMTHAIERASTSGRAEGVMFSAARKAVAAHQGCGALSRWKGRRHRAPMIGRRIAGLLFGAKRVLPIGAQSSVTGGATPTGGLLLSTDRLTTGCRSDSRRVGAGVPLETLQAHYVRSGVGTRRHRRSWAPSQAASSRRTPRVRPRLGGTTRSWVDGLTVMLPWRHARARVGSVRGSTRGSRFVVRMANEVPAGRGPPTSRSARSDISRRPRWIDRSVHRR
jgi:hypothetical protein